MANQQHQKQPLNVLYTTPTITEHDHQHKDLYHDDNDIVSSGCFRLFCCFDNHNRNHNDGETTTFLYQNQSEYDLINKDMWFMKRVKSLKDYSELVAGPKWKNFIRRFSRKTKTTKCNANMNTMFQYDPKSYALNFNDGDDHEDDDLLPRSFSTRFAPPSRSLQT